MVRVTGTPRRRAQGMTLVELLVAMTVFATVLVITASAYVTFASYPERALRFGQQQFSDIRLQWDVTRALNGVIPYVVYRQDGEVGFYFLGRAEGMTAVTTAAMTRARTSAVMRLFAEPLPDGPGYALIYEEAPLDGGVLRRADQTLDFEYRAQVATFTERPTFRYRLNRRDGDVARPEWVEAVDGLQETQQPDRVIISVGSQELAVVLADGAGRRMARSLDDV